MAHAGSVADHRLSRDLTFGFRAWTGPSGRMAAAHRHGEVEINLPIDRPMGYLLNGRHVALPAGRLGLFWGAWPHRLVSDPPGRCCWITLPLTLWMQWSLPDRMTRDLLAGRLLIDRAAAAVDEQRWSDWAADLGDHASERSRRTAAMEIEARLRRMAYDHGWLTRPARGGRRAPAPDRDGPAQRMARFIAQRFADPIAVIDIARHVGLHPHYAMKIFRHQMGLSIGRYLTRQRVAEAQRLLLTTDRPILEVMADAGFNSVSRFYAAFKAATGRAPADYRRFMR